jgi:hypothetical protein
VGYNRTTNEQMSVQIPETFRPGYSIISSKNFIFITGSVTVATRKCLSFDGTEWSQSTTLWSHEWHGSVIHDQTIFLVSGLKCKNVERFSASIGSWEQCPSVFKARSKFICVGNGDAIFIGGGYTRDGAKSSRSMEKFERNHWVKLQYKFPHRLASPVAFLTAPTTILIMGGYDIKHSTYSHKVYDFDLELGIKDKHGNFEVNGEFTTNQAAIAGTKHYILNEAK